MLKHRASNGSIAFIPILFPDWARRLRYVSCANANIRRKFFLVCHDGPYNASG